MERPLPVQPDLWEDIDGDELCLDFANTADMHAAPQPEEHLNQYADLVRWGLAAGLYSAPDGQRLLAKAEQNPGQAEQTLTRAIELREAIYRIFSAAANARPIPVGEVQVLNHYLSQALRQARVEAHGNGFGWGWSGAPDTLERMIWPAARSAAEVLTDPDRLARIGQCEDDRGCGWLFVDTSKNHSRRWCSMETCGNRAKAMRHYGRAKKKTTP